MIISMSDILCVTNRKLCRDDFLSRIEEIVECSPSAIILREKDLSEFEYEELAVQVMNICRKYNIPCILHSFVKTAIKLGADKIHLPLSILRNMTDDEKRYFKEIGASCHSVDDAIEAEKLGCTYISAGHIFATDCKKDLPPRGLEFLEEICSSVSVPVYAIGGIDSDNIESVLKAGAKGVCIMSGLMCCNNAEGYIQQLRKAGIRNDV